MARNEGLLSPDLSVLIHFPFETAVECLRYKFHHELANEYPVVVPPTLEEVGLPSVLRPYRFESQDQPKATFLGPEVLGYVVTNCEDYESFKEETLRLSRLLRKIFSIHNCTRLVVSQTQVLPFVRSNGFIPLSDLLTLEIRLPPDLPNNFGELRLGLVSPIDQGVIEIWAEPRTKRDTNEEGLLLSVRYDEPGHFDLDDLEVRLERAYLRCETTRAGMVNSHTKK